MTRFSAATAALLAVPTLAAAGGFERTALDLSPLFMDGTRAEMTLSYAQPTISGAAGPLSTGNIAEDLTTYALSFRTDLGEALSVALIFDEPYGATADYTGADPGIPGLAPLTATLTGQAVTALARYRFSDRFSVHGGLRYVLMDGALDLTPAGGVRVEFDADGDLGYVIGASYEIPDIALRASLTYVSETRHSHAAQITAPVTAPLGQIPEYVLPQSVALDLQTGIAENTLLLASVRWAEWSATSIDPLLLPVLSYPEDVVTYSAGLVRRFNDRFSALAQVSVEGASGVVPASLITPVDGLRGYTLAGIFSLGEATITAGVNYTELGDATVVPGVFGFSGNDTLSVGLRLGYAF